MNANDADVLISILVGFLAIVVAVCWMLALRQLPKSIIRRLLAGRPDVVVNHGLRMNMGLWDPSKPFRYGSLLYGQGRAVYCLRGDQIQLTWQPRKGNAVESAGPIPAQFRSADEANLRRARMHRRVLAAYITILAAAGITVGFLTESVLGGLIGVLPAICVLPFIATALRVQHQKRAVRA